MKNPVCQNPRCDNETKWFQNGNPKKYCSPKCNIEAYNRRRPRPRKVSKEMMFRHRSVRFLKFHGITYKDIAATFGVSKQWVQKSVEGFSDQDLFDPVA